MKNRKKLRRRLVILGGVVFLGIILLIAFYDKRPNDSQTVGFIMSGSIHEEGWNSMHYQGMKAACEDLGVNLIVMQSVLENQNQCGDAVRELVNEGAGMIVLSSYNYPGEVYDLIREYPKISFWGNAPEWYGDNLSCYFARIYQARYLAGIVAGKQCENGRIGYVAAMPNFEVNRGINAFTLGVKKANPNAEVIVYWTNSWDDKEAEEKAVEALVVEEKAGLITYHQKQGYVVDAAERLQVDSIGYHEYRTGMSDHYLTAVYADWKQVYSQLVQYYLKGQANSTTHFWIGLQEEAVKLGSYSDLVKEETKRAVEDAKREMLNGRDVFSGVIYDNTGVLRCGENESMSDDSLMEHMDWYVEGARFYEKESDKK